MSIRRLVATATVMALIAGGLAALTPGIGAMAGALAAAQRTADAAGPDALVLSAAGVAAWVVWSWGALGLALTAASVLPGVLGGAARVALYIALPAGARRSAALALGLGLGVAGPLVAPGALPAPLSTTAAASWVPPTAAGQAVDRTASPSATLVPDWPALPSRGGPAPPRLAARCPDGGDPSGRPRRLPLAHRERTAPRRPRALAHRRRGRCGDRGLVARQRRRHRPGPRPAAPGPGALATRGPMSGSHTGLTASTPPESSR